jgi:CHAT domain-containing protein/tetratricopeptide (TPR) repeat protein
MIRFTQPFAHRRAIAAFCWLLAVLLTGPSAILAQWPTGAIPPTILDSGGYAPSLVASGNVRAYLDEERFQVAHQQMNIFYPAPDDPGAPLPLDAGLIAMTLNRERALTLYSSAGDKVAQITGHAALAKSLSSQGNFDEAFRELSLAERATKDMGNPSMQADLLVLKANAQVSAGNFEKAIEVYGEAVPILRSLGDTKGQAELNNAIGWVFQSLGDMPNALRSYESALDLFVKTGNTEGEIRTRFGISSLYRSIGDYDRAAEQYLKVPTNAPAELRAQALVSAAELLQARNLSKGAAHLYQEALPLVKAAQDSILQVSILAGMGRSLMSLGSNHYHEAEEDFKQALTIAMTARNRVAEAGVLADIGELKYWMAIDRPSEYQDTCYSAALKNYGEALLAIREVGDRAGEIGVLSNTGLVYDAWGKKHDALRFYLEALRKMDQLHTSARLEEFRMNLAGQSASLYQRAVQLESDLHNPEDAFNLSERARARSFLDQVGNPRTGVSKDLPKEYSVLEGTLRQQNISLERQLGLELSKPGPDLNLERVRLLESRLSALRTEYENLTSQLTLSDPEYNSYLSILPLTLHGAQEQLAPDVTVVSYFTTEKTTLAFVITRDHAFAKELPVTEAELAKEVAVFLDFAGQEEGTSPLNSLYAELIAPIKSKLKTSKLVVVPYGTLHDLPFAALRNGAHYLGEDYVVSYLPSVSVLPYLRARIKPPNGQALVVANDEEEGLPRIGQVNEEANDVAAIMGTQPFLGIAATASVLRKSAGDFEIVHLIAHVELDRQSFHFSRILLGRGQGEDGPLTFDDVLSLDLKKTNLVVLSGCQSQMGKRSRGDDILGLSQAFMYAGAPSVMASLWSVDDEATRQLMVAFYTHLKTGISKAEALRSAQADVRQKYPNPFYWAGFTLAGDPAAYHSIAAN